jgi:poly-gamma-glutamate synthesis protein (capsule biosynthesis protein)
MAGIGYFPSIVNDDTIPSRIRRSPGDVIDDDVARSLRDADLLFGNLECVISDVVDPASSGNPKRYIAPPETIDFLHYAGFDVLNVGNNHTLDHGPVYLEETVTRLEGSDIRTIGNPLSPETPTTITREGTDLHFVGYNLYAEERESDETIVRTVERLQQRSGVVVVSLHWGRRCEHMLRPSPEQVEFGRDLIDSGADVVLGHHSHTFQPVERYEGGIIAYSLGNFLFDMWREENRTTGILEITIGADESLDVGVTPVEQIDNRVTYRDNDRIRNAVIDELDDVSREAYRREAEAVRRDHQRDVISQYVRNVHRFPPEFHAATLRRWSSKAITELKETTAPKL